MSGSAVRNLTGLTLVFGGVCLFAFIFNGSFSGNARNKTNYLTFSKFDANSGRVSRLYSGTELPQWHQPEPVNTGGLEAASDTETKLPYYGETAAASFAQSPPNWSEGLNSSGPVSFQSLPAMNSQPERIVDESSRISNSVYLTDQPATESAPDPKVITASYENLPNLEPVADPVEDKFDLQRSPAKSLNSVAPETPVTEQLQLPMLTSLPDVEASAVTRIEYGKSLARRGAFFAAREEFLNALYMVAEAHDRQSNGSQYSQRLKAGLRALEDVRAFGKVTRDKDTPQTRQFVLATLQTKLIAPNEVGQYSRNQLIEIFCRYAALQISQSLGNSPAASDSLFGCGKLLAAETKLQGAQEAINAQASWAFFWSAATVNPMNHESTNELGVLLLKSGRLVKAKEMFLQSLQGSNSPVYWNNLAETHRRIAEVPQHIHERNSQLSFANRAARSATVAANQVSARSAGQEAKYWVNSQQFRDQAAMPESQLGAAPSSIDLPHSTAPAADANTENGDGGILTKLKKWF